MGRTVEQVVTQWADGVVPDFNVDRTSISPALTGIGFRAVPNAPGAAFRLAAIPTGWRGAPANAATSPWNKPGCRWRSTTTRGGYEVADLGDAEEELRVQYLCGELSLRLGDVDEAITWFSQASRHPKLSENATWERLIREQWGSARASASALTETDSA